MSRFDAYLNDPNEFYRAARARMADPAFGARANEATKALQRGEPRLIALWLIMTAVSLRRNAEVYLRLGCAELALSAAAEAEARMERSGQLIEELTAAEQAKGESNADRLR